MTASTIKVYETVLGNLKIECLVDKIEDNNPKINVTSFDLMNSANPPKIEIFYYKEQVRNLVLFLQKVLEAHDALTENQ